ncbi:acyl-CoA dehydrogenase family protein [Hyalangium sp.]|uniref:acyl-CoA dehydrogenase family protein n=1 Tax=Hyalangium sp. TaxID=2028555 RepID=UPI002D735C85|nr:acyl-CoA dehydrogenase family protein [Hyalangium sp.]HYH97233.1 acyl-CoA dehydrogenase family protein [Hyalangium sp.]
MNEAWVEQIRERYRGFIKEKVNPGAVERDAAAATLSRELLREAASLGLFRLPLPKRLGGEAVDELRWGLVLEQLGYLSVDASFPTLVGLFVGTHQFLLGLGRTDLEERYLRPLGRGDGLVSFAYTEGADPFSFRSRALEVPGGYLLHGEKHMVSGGTIADAFIVYVRDEKNDLLAFLVERDDPGLEILPLQLSGLRALGVAALRLKDVRVGPERLLVASDGLREAQSYLNARRASVVPPMVGRMQAILEGCVESLGATLRYDRPLTDMQNVQARLGRMSVAVEISRAAMYRTLERLSRGETDALWDASISATKYFVTEQALQVAEAALRLLGTRAYLRENHFERSVRDFLAGLAAAGAQDTLEVDLGVMAISAIEQRRRQPPKGGQP